MTWPFRRVRKLIRKAWSKGPPTQVEAVAPTEPPEPVPLPIPPREPGPMRVVAVSRVLDEADIVEAFVRHTAAYVCHHVFLDNGSHDGSLEILRALKEEGFGITVLQNITVSFYQAEVSTYLYRHAARECRADWVLCLDSDEFIDDRGVEGGLTARLEALMAEDELCLTVPLVNYELAADDDPTDILIPRRMRRHGAVLNVNKVFVRGSIAATTDIGSGNHYAAEYGGPRLTGLVVPGLSIAHYPHRSPYQRAAKCVRGWSKVVATGKAQVARGSSYHYRSLFEIVRDRPQDFFRRDKFMKPPAHDKLPIDPITYRGGPLRYTSSADDPMRALRSMMGYVERLAERHGRLLEEIPEARARTNAWNAEIKEII